jgi:hypothetical protein
MEVMEAIGIWKWLCGSSVPEVYTGSYMAEVSLFCIWMCTCFKFFSVEAQSIYHIAGNSQEIY